MKHLFIYTLLLFSILSSVHAQRGRVQIQDGTLVTDKGTLLRGTFVSIDNQWNVMPARETVSAIKNYGLNCIHLYAENFWDINRTHPGYNMDKIDSLVAWTARDSLYMVLTFAGGITENNDSIINFIKSCWEIYSERYKDETHVIYEIYNEPGNMPFTDAIITLEKELYKIIRKKAPETHIQFLSPWNIYYPEIIDDIERLGDSIDWSNASIAGHAYQRPAQDYIEPIQRLKKAGYTITITEFHSLENKYANLALSRVFEQEYVSYLHFIDLNKLTDDPSVFKSRIESSEFRWTTDFGTWPESITEISYQSPYKYWPAIFYDEGSGWINDFQDAIITYISNNDYVAYYNIDFQNGPSSFEAFCSATASDGRIELRLDSLNGQLVGVCKLSGTGSLNNYETFTCNDITPFTGVHNLYLKFRRNDNSPMFNIKSWYFINSELSAPQTPFHGTAIVIPGKIEAEEYDIGEPTISYLDMVTGNQGFFFREDDVDIDSTRDGGYCIGWTGFGEWVEYTVSCQHYTAMDIQLRVASWEPGKKFNIKLNNKKIASVYLDSIGSYSDWELITIKNIAILAGENQVLRVELSGGNFNLDWMNFVVSNPSGIDEAKNNKTFTFYPNPAHNYIKVKTTRPVTVEIYSLQGQLLVKKQLLFPNQEIPLYGLVSGSYIVKIISDKVFSEALIIE